jgi:hypothetical protein
MMTNIGKGMVLGIFVFSLALAAMAWGILGNQIDWASTPGVAEADGLHDIKLKAIESEQGEMKRLRALWKEENDKLFVREGRRLGNSKFYVSELANLRGQDAKGQEINEPVRVLTYQPDGRLIVDGNGRPVMAPNPDLKNQRALEDDLRKLEGEVQATIKQVNDLIEEQYKLTLQLRGDPGKVKGLLALLEDAERDKRNAEAELEAARQEAINGRVAAQALLNRQRQLQARVKELRELGLAQRQP